MRTPGHWYRPAGPGARLLAPLGRLYGAAGALRQALARPRRAGVPVVCVGNLVAGGAGKTPVALALAEALAGRRVHFVTRGHGGRERGPLRVLPDRHRPEEVGDEALLLAAARPTWVARDRLAGAKAAAAGGAELVVLDDGFQNPHIAKDLSLLVIDGAVGFGNGLLIPAGPLREPVARGLARADAVVVIGGDGKAPCAGAGKPVLAARLEPAAEARALAGRRAIAFAGIGRPEKFFDTCRALGIALAAGIPFPDHHPYGPADLDRLARMAETEGAELVTTAKDAVRLPPGFRGRVRVVEVTVVWDDPGALRRLLARLPEEARPHGP